MAEHTSFGDIVDFVEERGGSLGGEARYELLQLVSKYAHDMNALALSNWEAGRG
jgi:hypothetical protein